MEEEPEEQLWKQFLELDGDGGEISLPTQQLSESYLLGFVIANIVGLRHYHGRINGREMVGLVREPLNPYDPNAIKVLNTRTVQVGHIERSAAAALAPLVDSRLITIEGIVPKPPKNPNAFHLPCQIHIFALADAFPAVRAALASAGLLLISSSDPGFSLSESAVVQETKKKKKESERSIDEIFALVGKGDANGDAVPPMEPNKEVITSELFLHQKVGLGWLLLKENSNDLPPFWEERDGIFLNLLTNHQTHERPESLKGGIFADDMGLGKTLTLLSLIATNRPSSRGVVVSDGNRSRTGKKEANPWKKQRISGGSCSSGDEILGPKATLVVCPSTVLSTWVTQLEQHTRRDGLKVYMYHGERTREPKELMEYDLVLTTFKILASEFGIPNSPLQEIEWLRVIIDEAHVIKNFATQQTKAVTALKAKRRWVVTGTPIQNSPFDLFSLMAFLRFQPFSIKSYWQSFVQRPLDQGSECGISRLQVGSPYLFAAFKLTYFSVIWLLHLLIYVIFPD